MLLPPLAVLLSELAALGTAYAAPVQTMATPVPTETSDLLGPLNPEDKNGVRIDHYDIMADTGGMTDFEAKILFFFTNMLFAVGRWIVDWCLSFDLAKLLLKPVIDLCEIFQTQVIDRARLDDFALLAAAAICGAWILLGRRSRGISEITVTLAIAAVAATALTSPATTLFGSDGLLGQTRDLSAEVAALTLTGGTKTDGGEEKVIGTVRGHLVDAFVRQPHQMINFGRIVENKSSACRQAYRDVVAKGPWGSNEEGRAMIERCDPKARKFADKPTIDRLGAALLTVVAALVVGVLAIIIALALLVTQLWLVFEAIRLLFALVVGLIPGPGRAQLWKAVGGITSALAAVAVTVVGLALFAVLVGALLAGARGPLVVKFLLLDLTVFCALAWYRRLLKASRSIGAKLSRRLGAPIATPGPPAVRQMLSESGGELRKVAAPVARTARELRPSQIRYRAGQARKGAALVGEKALAVANVASFGKLGTALELGAKAANFAPARTSGGPRSQPGEVVRQAGGRRAGGRGAEGRPPRRRPDDARTSGRQQPERTTTRPGSKPPGGGVTRTGSSPPEVAPPRRLQPSPRQRPDGPAGVDRATPSRPPDPSGTTTNAPTHRRRAGPRADGPKRREPGGDQERRS